MNWAEKDPRVRSPRDPVPAGECGERAVPGGEAEGSGPAVRDNVRGWGRSGPDCGIRGARAGGTFPHKGPRNPIANRGGPNENNGAVGRRDEDHDGGEEGKEKQRGWPG